MSDFIWLASFLALQAAMYLLFGSKVRRSDERISTNIASIPGLDKSQEPVGEWVATLRYRRNYQLGTWAFAFGLLGYGLLLSVILSLAPQDSGGMDWVVLLGVVTFYFLFGVFPWMLVLYVYGNACTVTSNGLLSHSWHGPNRFIRWEDVDQVKLVFLNRGKSAYRVKTSEGTIGISGDFENLSIFLSAVQLHVPQSKIG